MEIKSFEGVTKWNLNRNRRNRSHLNPEIQVPDPAPAVCMLEPDQNVFSGIRRPRSAVLKAACIGSRHVSNFHMIELDVEKYRSWMV